MTDRKVGNEEVVPSSQSYLTDILPEGEALHDGDMGSELELSSLPLSAHQLTLNPKLILSQSTVDDEGVGMFEDLGEFRRDRLESASTSRFAALGPPQVSRGPRSTRSDAIDISRSISHRPFPDQMSTAHHAKYQARPLAERNGIRRQRPSQ